MTFDLAIENARIVDGTGTPWFRGHVAVADGEIARISRAANPEFDADRTIDAGETILCPGFVDAHSHSDLELFAGPTLEPKIRQGITTEILGQDGFSMGPIYREGGPEQFAAYLRGLAGTLEREWSWNSLGEYLDEVEANGVAPNVATLVGHGTVRFEVLGMEDATPTESELEEMADLVAEGLEDGAVGFSTGLVYTPQVYAETDEVRRLASELAPHGRPFVAHIRSESRGIWEALDEFVDIGAETGVPLHLSHFKVAGKAQHGKADRALELVEAARERGVDFTAEQYPYAAGCTMLSSVLPPWVDAEDADETLALLEDPKVRERIARDIEEDRIDGWENSVGTNGWEIIRVTNLDSEAYADVEGQSVAEIAADSGLDPVDVVCEILLAEELEASMTVHVMDEADVRTIMESERVGVGTDGLFGGNPHPRVYGTYPRILGHYVREENLFTLEEAIRKMTSLPARSMGLNSKGIIREGMDADLVVFDPEIVSTSATYENPRRFPVGIDHVIVGGEPVVEDGETTGALPGDVIRAPES